MKLWLTIGTGLALGLPGIALAQLDMSSFYTQTVKTGQPWASINTSIQNLDLQIEVNRGVVTTRATIEYKPDAGITSEYRCTPALDSCAKNSGSASTPCSAMQCGYVNVSTKAFDSLETTASFQLEDNTVISDMYLWVGETRVKAALQERALASAQYESIVQRRRDPALIESWGNGSYNLRIFPNETDKARKIQIEFVQGMENEESRLLTRLPVTQTPSKMNVYYLGEAVNYDTVPYRVIGQINLEIVSVDGKTYDLDWPGIGSGKVGATPLKLSSRNVKEIKTGNLTIPTSSCASCLTPWTAEKSGTGYFGVKALLQGKNLRLGGQPTERHFILDINGSTKDTVVTERARKVALLSLKAYGVAPYTANLGFSDGKGKITYVFGKPVSMDASQLQQAYTALREWKPAGKSDAHATMHAFAEARGNAADTALLYLINNDTANYFYWPGGVWTDAAQAQYNAFEKAEAAKDSVSAQELKAAKTMLFGFWNNYRLGNVARATGGFQVGGLYGYYYYYAPVMTVDSGAVIRDPFSNLQLPPLFGPGRPDAYVIADLKVEAQGHTIQNLTVLQQSSNTYYYRGGGGIAVDMVLNKKASSIAPYRYVSPDSIPLRISGQYQGSGQVTLKVSGLWGGLPFFVEYALDLPSFAGGNALGAGIWALQRSEMLGRDYTGNHVAAIQQLGKDYHIVNQQMSLLALEPGVDLWTEMPSKATSTSIESRTASDAAMTPGGASGGSVDNVTLEAILNGFVPILPGQVAGKMVLPSLMARSMGNQVELNWANVGQADQAEFVIVSLKGHVVATLVGKRQGNGYQATWTSPKQQGLFVVMAKAGKLKQVQTLYLGQTAR